MSQDFLDIQYTKVTYGSLVYVHYDSWKYAEIYLVTCYQVTANNHATFTIQIHGRLRDYLRLLMGRTLFKMGQNYRGRFFL